MQQDTPQDTHRVCAEQLHNVGLWPPAAGMQGWLLEVSYQLAWSPLQDAVRSQRSEVQVRASTQKQDHPHQHCASPPWPTAEGPHPCCMICILLPLPAAAAAQQAPFWFLLCCCCSSGGSCHQQHDAEAAWCSKEPEDASSMQQAAIKFVIHAHTGCLEHGVDFW